MTTSTTLPSLTLTQMFLNFLDPRKTMIWIILFVILILIAAVYGYYQFYVPSAKFRNFNDLSNKIPLGQGQGDGSDVLVYFFHADWCPHCSTAAPEWSSFVKNYDGAEVNGHTIRCVDVNCTDDSNAETQDLIQEYKVQGYPTIKMLKNGKTIDFDAKVTNNFLEQFIINMVGPLNSKVDKNQY